MRLYPQHEQPAEAATHDNSRETGFAENWQYSLGLTITEDLPIISRMIPTVTESNRTAKLNAYRLSGEIPEDVFDYYGSDTDGLSYYARNNLGLDDIPTNKDYEDQKMVEYANQRQMTHKVQSQQNAWGLAGQIAGTAHGMALDPIYATSFLTGYGGAATVGQAALRVGVMEAGIEAVAQLPKMEWKEQIGANYSGSQAMIEILFAGAGGAVIGAAGKALGKLFTPRDMTVQDALNVIESGRLKDVDLETVSNTLKNSDPNANALDTMTADEAIDIAAANRGPKRGTDPKGDPEIKVSDIDTQAEETFNARAGVVAEGAEGAEEGVPRGTPKDDVPDTRNPIVKEADDAVLTIDDNLKAMEECF